MGAQAPRTMADWQQPKQVWDILAIYSTVAQTSVNDIAEGRRMTVEIISWSISTKVWDRTGIKLATPGSAVRYASVARHVTDYAKRPGDLEHPSSSGDLSPWPLFWGGGGTIMSSIDQICLSAAWLSAFLSYHPCLTDGPVCMSQTYVPLCLKYITCSK